MRGPGAEHLVGVREVLKDVCPFWYKGGLKVKELSNNWPVFEAECFSLPLPAPTFGQLGGGVAARSAHAWIRPSQRANPWGLPAETNSQARFYSCCAVNQQHQTTEEQSYAQYNTIQYDTTETFASCTVINCQDKSEALQSSVWK